MRESTSFSNRGLERVGKSAFRNRAKLLRQLRSRCWEYASTKQGCSGSMGQRRYELFHCSVVIAHFSKISQQLLGFLCATLSYLCRRKRDTTMPFRSQSCPKLLAFTYELAERKRPYQEIIAISHKAAHLL
jgi:hypothetical protein